MTPRVRIDGQRPTTESFAIHTRKIHVRRFIVHLHRRARVSRVLHPRLAIPSRRLDADAASRANPRLAPAASSATSRALPARAPLASSSHRRAFVSLSLRRRAPSRSNRPSSRRVAFEIRSVVRSHRSRRSHHRARRDDRVAHARRAARRSSSRRSRVASHRFVVPRRRDVSSFLIRQPFINHSFDPVARRRHRPTDRPTDRCDAMRCDG